MDAVNDLGADMIAVTGDLVDGSVRDLARHTQPLSRLTARHGAFFVTGNHEYYSGVHAWIGELRRLGLAVLLNEHVVLRHEGESVVVVAGVTDYTAGLLRSCATQRSRRRPGRARRATPASGCCSRTSRGRRSPRRRPGSTCSFPATRTAGSSSRGISSCACSTRSPPGSIAWDALWVYISRGTGYWGPPKRLGAPSEITYLRLVPE